MRYALPNGGFTDIKSAARMAAEGRDSTLDLIRRTHTTGQEQPFKPHPNIAPNQPFADSRAKLPSTGKAPPYHGHAPTKRGRCPLVACERQLIDRASYSANREFQGCGEIGEEWLICSIGRV